ncbi:MAG TPA: amino acid adenylation domain-containing protein, partial [Streptomyces sp.]
TAAPIPAARVHELFEAQADRDPGRVALIIPSEPEAEVLTYGELEARANRLARHLRRLGVGPEVAVGLCVERSADLVVGLLGILKAGGLYLPLDPAYPRERLAFMLEDSRAPVVVTQERLASALSSGPRRVLLDADRQAIAAESGARPEPAASEAAYLIYTSGSTGRPKGVQVLHRGMVNFLAAMAERPGLAAGDVLLSVTTLSFDIAGLEIYLPLLVGARVVLADRETAADGAALLRLLAASGATVMQATPATWRLLLAAGWEAPRLKVLCGGEALPRELAEELAPRAASLWNLYGPTETTIWSTVHRVETDGPARPVPIGRPIANTVVHLVDRAFAPVAAGVAGELCIGGASVARGYFGRPELTAERFVPDPFTAEPGARLYRTGDLARRRPGGEIEYLGRLDHQVKVRGFRIELGEIEAALASHPGVRQAVILACGEGGDRRLVAYLLGAAGAAELRDHLRARLPEPMVPSAFVTLETFPLTPNGKVDRRALARVAPEAEAEIGAAPRTAIEELLAGIWAELLGLEEAGAATHFFAAGGHSLLATQAVARVQRVLGVELPVRALFEAPTVEAFAARVEAARRSGTAAALPPLVPVERPAEPPLSFSQERLWFMDQLEPGNAVYHIPAALRLEGELDAAALERAFAGLVARHEALRTVFPAVDGRPVQRIVPAAPFRLPSRDLTDRPDELGALIREEARRPFDLARGPLLRVTLVRLGPAEHVLLVTLPHIVADGWSVGVLVREVAALYAGETLPALPVQYADFALWQRRTLSGEALESGIAWWRQRLAGAAAELELPFDRPRPAVRGQRGGTVPVRLTEELITELATLARREGATLYMALLAGFQALLGRMSGQEDVPVGSPVANRTRVELEGLIGFFVNTLVLRGDLAGDPGFGALLGRTREAVLEAQARQEVPFEKLVEALAPERSLGRTPLIQAMLAFQNAPAGPPRLGSLAVRFLPVDSGAARLDLTLSVAARDGVLAGEIEYDAELFDAPTVLRLAGLWERLLAAAVRDPGARISSLELLAAAERWQLLAEWSDTAAAYPREICLHELLTAQARRSPEAVALVCGERSLTYAELDRRAGRLAGHLAALGVGPDDRVGVLAERSVEMVVALLGVLKAGAAYVPLDPELPAERLAFMAGEAVGGGVVLAQTHLLDREVGTATVVPLDATASEAIEVIVPAEAAAYVIYTSGSTGRPKGVVNSHRGIVNRLLWMQETYGLTADDRVLQKTPFSFDVSIWEFFWPLLAGARLVMAPPGAHRDPAELARLIRAAGITTVHFVPSMLQAFLADEAAADCRGALRRVICSGEALPYELEQNALRVLDCEVWNLYGPTEAAVDVTYQRCAPAGVSRPVAIGRPVANTAIHLADRGFALAPMGVAGELLIGGVQVARGYLARPELTAERFVPDPFSSEPGARLYRTGDLARFRANGEIEYLGRLDHQVKVRGVRVELGEIEAALESHPGVRQAVVLAPGEGGDRWLVAYLLGEAGAAELRDHLRARLPEAMVP